MGMQQSKGKWYIYPQQRRHIPGRMASQQSSRLRKLQDHEKRAVRRNVGERHAPRRRPRAIPRREHIRGRIYIRKKRGTRGVYLERRVPVLGVLGE